MRLKSSLVAALVGGLVASTLPATAASAGPVVPDPLFGQHIKSISAGVPAGLGGNLGSVRLWDSGVTWREIETADNQYNWGPLDAAVDNARASGASEVMYTLGSTPQWAAADPNSKLGLYGPGSNSHPKSNDLYLDYLRAVAERYGTKITSYQVWNEANLKDFYLGTPDQMANLTRQARDVLRQVAPHALLVAASTTVRDKGPVARFGKAYGKAMRKVGWPVDVVSAHFYPPATFGPAKRVKYIKVIKRYYKRWGARSKPLWDTEMNFGDTRGYMKVRRQYTGAKAQSYVARTFLDSMRYGVSRVFWYGWDIHVLGTDMTARNGSGAITEGGAAFITTRRWMSGKVWNGCRTKRKITTCRLQDGAAPVQILYTTKARTMRVPAGMTRIEFLDGSSGAVSAGQRIRVTAVPVLLR